MLSDFVTYYNDAGSASSFLQPDGTSTVSNPYVKKDKKLYYKFSLDESVAAGTVYLSSTTLDAIFNITVNSTVIPAIPPIAGKTLTLPTALVVFLSGSTTAAKINANEFSVGGCTL